MKLTRRSYQKELLDGEDIPFADVQQNMRELDKINSLLGGHRITIKGFNLLRDTKQPVHVCEIGCGGGDNLLAIYKWCKKLKIEVRFTGIDIKEECIRFAKTKEELQSCTTWLVSDYKKAKLANKPDIVFSSLFCHHFTDAELALQLQWMQQHASVGFFINDLQRHAVAYHSIQWLTKFFSHSYLVKNDAPLSVAKGFTKKDWQKIFAEANITRYEIYWQWAFRHLILYRNEHT